MFSGAVYGDKEIDKTRQACQGLSSVPWLRINMALPRTSVGPGYAEHVV
jgi:hypothetical protein